MLEQWRSMKSPLEIRFEERKKILMEEELAQMMNPQAKKVSIEVPKTREKKSPHRNIIRHDSP